MLATGLAMDSPNLVIMSDRGRGVSLGLFNCGLCRLPTLAIRAGWQNYFMQMWHDVPFRTVLHGHLRESAGANS